MAKYKVVISDHEYLDLESERRAFSDEGLDVEIADPQTRDIEKLKEIARDADALIVQYAKVPAELIGAMERCKCIVRYAMGVDGIDLDAATGKGIYVCNVAGYCTDEVATHALGLLLDINRRISKYDAWVRSGRWYHMPGTQPNLREQRVGVISFGRIARAFAERVKPNCAEVWAYDDYVPEEVFKEAGVEKRSFDEILAECDYISVHCPLTEETRHMFDKTAFRKMKNTAVLINVARGAVVCEDDLVWALENGEIGGAALDVMEKEPAEPNNPLFSFDNVMITPHTAWYSEAAQAKLQYSAAREAAQAIAGKVPDNVCNREVLK